jgi:hypothetical protein
MVEPGQPKLPEVLTLPRAKSTAKLLQDNTITDKPPYGKARRIAAKAAGLACGKDKTEGRGNNPRPSIVYSRSPPFRGAAN